MKADEGPAAARGPVGSREPGVPLILPFSRPPPRAASDAAPDELPDLLSAD